MKRFALITILPLLFLAGCSNTGTDNRESVARIVLQQQVETESQGAMTLDSFKKTNGMETSEFGITGYELDWEAQITTKQDVWVLPTKDYPPANFPPGTWLDFKSYPKESNARHLNANTHIRFAGKSLLQKKENGWEVRDHMNYIMKEL